jgi:hypothetical protein
MAVLLRHGFGAPRENKKARKTAGKTVASLLEHSMSNGENELSTGGVLGLSPVVAMRKKYFRDLN